MRISGWRSDVCSSDLLSAPSALRVLPRGAEDKIMTQTIGRRSLLRAGVVGAAGLGFSSLFPAWAQTGSMGQMPTLSGEDIHLKIANTPFTVGGDRKSTRLNSSH